MNNLSLYSIADEYLQAVSTLSDLDLPDEVIADTLESLQYPLEQKATNVAMFARNLEATADAIKEAEGEMAKRRKALESRAANIRAYLLQNMVRAGISKIECPMFKLAVRDNPPSVVIDGDVPAEFMRQPEPPPPAPDKKAIGEALKAGRDVPGAHLLRGQRLEIK
jgi:hypothetical protein